jgi:hypothetical protein
MPTAHAQQVREQLLHPAEGHVLLLHQVDRQGADPRSVLRPAGDFGGKGADAHLRTGGAAHVQRPMFAHPQAHGRQLVDLAPLVEHDGRCLTQGGLAGSAHDRTVLDHFVGQRHQPQRLAPVTQLPARLLAALCSQTLRLALESVTARRLGAVVAVPLGMSQLLFQLAVAGQQLFDLLALLGDESFQLGNTLLGAHASMLHRCASLSDLLHQPILNVEARHFGNIAASGRRRGDSCKILSRIGVLVIQDAAYPAVSLACTASPSAYQA